MSRYLSLALALLSVGFAFAAQTPPGPMLRLKAASFDPLRGVPSLPDRLALGAEPDGGIFVVQFATPVVPAALARLRAAGATPLEYVPEQGYLVRLASGAASSVRALPGVRWLGPLEPGWKLAPDLGTRPYQDPERRTDGLVYATADLFEGEDADDAALQAGAAGARVLQIVRFGPYARLKLRASLGQLEQVARIPAVAWIEEAAEITLRNNTTRWVVQTNVPSSTTVWDHGIRGEGQIIGHIDGRIDMNSCYIRDLADNTPGPTHRKVVAYRSSSGTGADSHGTHTAGTAAGDQFPISGTIDSNGNAYAARISHSNLSDISGSGAAPSNLYDYLTAAHDDGARVHTNSWGDDGTVAYTSWCVDIDRFSYDHEDSLVTFAVTNTSTLKTPENAKNCLAVGASRNGASAGDFCSGGRGPTSDGRRKPEIFAPGCSIVSARSNSACSTTSSTGTSMASPAVAAVGALVREYFEKGWYPTGVENSVDAFVPTGALTKAVLLNGSVDMTGIAGYPSFQEGWGRVLLENALYFDGDARRLAVLDDLRNSLGLGTGQESSYTLSVDGSTEPLAITAVWTEPPASLLAAQATVNDLDLEVVSPTGATYLGNVFDPASGTSIVGGAADAVNNVEQVRIASPTPGDWTVRIRGTAVNQGTQGYAVVASGEVTPVVAPLRYASHAVQDAVPLGNGDGIADPGETIVMPISLKNATASPATGVAGIVSAREPDDARLTRSAASWPEIAPGATAESVAPHVMYTIQPEAACGSRLQFQVSYDSGLGPGSAAFAVDVGRKTTAIDATGLPLAIPKKSASGVSSTIEVPDAFTIGDVNVFVDIGHGDVGELFVQLRSPQATTVVLHNKSLGGTADIVATYDLERVPDGPGAMSDFDGEQAQGNWTLSVGDAVGGSVPAGVLRAWRLEFTATSVVACSPLSCGEPVPGDVGASLVVAKENGSDLRLSWSAVAGAASYRIWRSPTPDFAGEVLLAETSDTTFVETDALTTNETWTYRVRAVNVCAWEGP